MAADFAWHEAHGSEATARAITATLGVLDKYWDGRKSYLDTAGRLYSNAPIANAFGVPATSGGFGSMGSRLTRNVVQSAVDTVTARVASRIKPTVMWLSTQGSYRARRRAKRLTRFTDGLFREQSVATLMPRVFKDACVFGAGFVAVVLEHGRIRFERILESELRWDEVEARYAPPRQLHRVRPVDRERLLAMWPSKAGVINKTDAFLGDNKNATQQRPLAPLVRVRESWRLPDGPEAHGRHVISVPGGVLVDEEWDHDFFPIIKLDYNSRTTGWVGQGLVEILADTQVALNRVLHAISTSLYLMGTFKVGIDVASGINPADITNGFGTVFTFRRTAAGGGPPVYLTPPAIQAELFQEAERLEQKAFQLAGVSQMTAAGLKTPGVNAAVAMRQMVDIENDRFATVSANYERAHVELGRVAIELLADSVKRGEVDRYTVQDLGSKRRPVVDFKDIDFDRDEFSIQAFPVSSLPTDPEGRLQTVQEWIQAGWLDPKQGRRLLDFPDISAWESLQDAASDWIELCLDSIVDDHRFVPIDPDEDDLKRALELVTQEISLAKVGGLEDDDPEAMRLLRRWRDEVIRHMSAAQAAMAPPPMPGASPAGPGAAPMGVPPPQPVSELMPIAPQ